MVVVSRNNLQKKSRYAGRKIRWKIIVILAVFGLTFASGMFVYDMRLEMKISDLHKQLINRDIAR